MLLNHKEIFLVDVWSAEGRLQLRRWFGIGEPGEGKIGEHWGTLGGETIMTRIIKIVKKSKLYCRFLSVKCVLFETW